jgi:hypothetical protein
MFFINIGKEAYFFTSQPQNLGQLRGKSSIKLSLLVGEMVTETALAIKKIKSKYKID